MTGLLWLRVCQVGCGRLWLAVRLLGSEHTCLLVERG
mgnify:CR=1 FL=1